MSNGRLLTRFYLFGGIAVALSLGLLGLAVWAVMRVVERWT